MCFLHMFAGWCTMAGDEALSDQMNTAIVVIIAKNKERGGEKTLVNWPANFPVHLFSRLHFGGFAVASVGRIGPRKETCVQRDHRLVADDACCLVGDSSRMTAHQQNYWVCASVHLHP